MHPRENRQGAEILQFPIEARRAAVEMSRRFSTDRLPDFVAIREEAERNRQGH